VEPTTITLPEISTAQLYGYIVRQLLHGDTAFVYSHCGAAVSISLSLIKYTSCNKQHYIPGENISIVMSIVLRTGISLHRGSVGQPVVGSSARDFERWVKGALEVRHLSLIRGAV
jgi:hypothetical protein